MDKRYFREKVAEWYLASKRNLPWRGSRDPYKIWLSEIILQQTRIIQGLPYYLRFLQEYPDVSSLAAAPEQKVLRLWQGLGYYSRARNLHRCAKVIVSQHRGSFPSRYSDLLSLPGVGSYTAAAIASICFFEPVAVLDGNVFRVLSRVFGIDADIASPAGKKIFSTFAAEIVPEIRPDLHNQALMEFGALWCTPKQPKCEICPLKHSCFAFHNNLQALLPVKAKSKKPVKRFFYYFVLTRGKSLMMKKRNSGDIWQGLYDFYLIEKKRSVNPLHIMKDDPFLHRIARDAESVQSSPVYRHLLSHQTIHSKFVIIKSGERPPKVEETALKYYSVKKISDLPKPVLISRFLSDYNIL